VATFAYRPGTELLHRIHPLAKIAALILSSALCLRVGIWSMAFSAVISLLAALLAGIKPGELLRNGRFLFWMGLWVVPASCLEPGARDWLRPEALPGALAYMGRLALVFIASEAFFKTTNLDRLADAITGLTRRIGLKGDPGFYIGLAASFLPRLMAQAEAALEAARARGLGRRLSLRAMRAIVGAILVRAINGAFDRVSALEARAYDPGRTLRLCPFGPADIVAMGLPAGALALVALLGA
jgi:energy-coupling factor transporter transmembrane protein EcfT